MAASPIMVINFGVRPEKEPEFNDFYQHRFIPELIAVAPEIVSARRYEELGTGGTLRWYNKQFLTIYELSSEDAIEKSDALFGRPEFKDTLGEFQRWKAEHLRNFSRITFRNSWEHERQAADGPFGNRPFFLWALEMNPDKDAEFQHWYENDYLPRQIADVPTWTCCRRYVSAAARGQTRHLTFFEAPDEATLARCLLDLRAPHRISENYEWQKRVEPAIAWHDASSFRPIFRRPG